MDGESKSIYIGNIPFDYTEEQVLEIAKSVGPVMDLKLLFDPMTGKSKGYSFVKYGDHETAESAVRNLNNMPIGNRNLKCSFSNDSNAGFPNDGPSSNSSSEKLPPLPLGVQIYPNQSAPQVISNILANLDSESALKLIKEAKTMSTENPGLMKTLLDRYPQLSHALVETTLLLNLANRDTIELTLNKQQPVLHNLTPDHVKLLKEINSLTEKEISILDDDRRKIISQIKEEIHNGSYGKII